MIQNKFNAADKALTDAMSAVLQLPISKTDRHYLRQELKNMRDFINKLEEEDKEGKDNE